MALALKQGYISSLSPRALLRRPRYSLPASSPKAVADQLRHFRICHVQNALPYKRSLTIKAMAERVMSAAYGGNYATVFGELIGERTWRVNISVIQHILESPIRNILAAYFRRVCGTEDMVMPLMNLVVRRYDPKDSGSAAVAIPFHQDGKLLPPSFRMLNCWTLLSPNECGKTSPGLEFIPQVGRLLDLAPIGRSIHYGFLETDHTEIDRLLDSYDTLRPSINLGDVMMFNEIALHRTWLSPSQLLPRYSAEVRFFGFTREVAEHRHNTDSNPYFDLIGDTLSGPAVIKQTDDGILRETERGTWEITRTNHHS